MEKQNTLPLLNCQETNASYGVREVPTEIMSLSHVQRLVHLLDRGDISEIALDYTEENLHLVLRKFKEPEPSAHSEDAYPVDTKLIDCLEQPSSQPELYHLTSQTVGVFHPYLKPRGENLVAAGDLVKAGQVVGTIEALSILIEITAPVAGYVREIFVQDGQSVEYGQLLMTIDQDHGEV